MKLHPITNTPVVEATDEYRDAVHCEWLPVPSFWVGSFAASFTHAIRGGAPKLTTAQILARDQLRIRVAAKRPTYEQWKSLMSEDAYVQAIAQHF